MIATWLMLVAAGWAAEPREDQPKQPDRSRFPAGFATTDEASKWTKAQFAGGRVDEVADDEGDCLVVFQHGSGAPVIRIGLYRKGDSRWNLVLERRPPEGNPEFLRASTVDGRIVLVGKTSGRIWPLAPAD